jgi:hypothetical protein
MAKKNFPGPQQLRFFYTTAPSTYPGLQHKQTFNVEITAGLAPGAAFSTMTVKRRVGSDLSLQVAVDAWLTILRGAIYNTGSNTVDYVELWDYEPLTDNGEFVSVYPVGLAGTGATSAPGAGIESILTFRTLEGGIMRVHTEEPQNLTGNPTDTRPFTYASATAMADHIESVDNVFLGKDTSFPFAVIAHYPGQNERLFKKRNRP